MPDPSFFVHPSFADARLTAARDPFQPATVLASLAASRECAVRQALALNPSATVELLQLLAADKDPYTKINVAANPNTPLKLLLRMTRDRDKKVAETAFVTLESRL